MFSEQKYVYRRLNCVPNARLINGPTTILVINVHYLLGGERFTENLEDQVEDGNIILA